MQVKQGSTVLASYVYDGDGVLVKKVAGGQTTVYVGAHYEKNLTTGVVTKYYYLGSQRVAMRVGGTLTWIHGDHLGSASLTTNASRAVVGEMRYFPYGETRWTTGTVGTDRRYTGQREEAGLGLYDYNARYYDPALGRFLQADTIVPEAANPQSLNRYSYVYNNPLRYVDPTGHDGSDGGVLGGDSSDPLAQLDNEQEESEMYIISLIQAGRWDEYRRYQAFLKLIHPGSIGVYKWSGRFPGPGDVPLRHWRRGGGVHRHRRVSRRTSVSTRLPQPRSIQNEPLLNQLAIYEVEEISEEARHDAAAYAVTQYGTGYSYSGLWSIAERQLVRRSGTARNWWSRLWNRAASHSTRATWRAFYVDRFVPLLPVEMPYYRTTAGSNSAWAITTRWGNSSPLRKTW